MTLAEQIAAAIVRVETAKLQLRRETARLAKLMADAKRLTRESKGQP